MLKKVLGLTLEEKCYNFLTDDDFMKVYDELLLGVKNKYDVSDGDYLELIHNNCCVFEGIMDEDFTINLTDEYMMISDGTGNVWIYFNENINRLVFIKQ